MPLLLSTPALAVARPAPGEKTVEHGKPTEAKGTSFEAYLHDSKVIGGEDSQRAFCCLHKGDAVVCVFLRCFEAFNLCSHFFRDSQTSCVVACAVDSVTGRKFFKIFAQRAVVVAQLPVSVKSCKIV